MGDEIWSGGLDGNMPGVARLVPRDVSLVSLDDHPAFEWFKPEVSRSHPDTRRWVPE